MAATGAGVSDAEAALQELVAECYDDPLRFVLALWPWGEPDGPLALETGPDAIQRAQLIEIGAMVRERRFDGAHPAAPLLFTRTSGHGTGKSALGAWIACWLLSTRPGSRGTITAGTATQLQTRTWAAVQYWISMCLTRHWFIVQAQGIYALAEPKNWFCVPQTCRKENAQSFAGQHAKASTSWYLFDEASEVPDTIFETAYGGITDGEPMMFVWGQMVRNTGEFYRINYGKLSPRWNHARIDSRESSFTNKDLIAQWASDYGEDSDFYRVRVLGYPPRASELQYIDRGRVEAARARVQTAGLEEPLVAGFDVSGGGKAWNVIRFRRGLNGKVRPPIRIPGEKDPDRSQRIGICAELLADTRPESRLSALFVDSAFGAAIVAVLHTMKFTNAYEVNFGGESPDPDHCFNMRAYMYTKAKDWMLHGALPDEDLLADQLMLPGYHIHRGGKLVLERKEDVLARGEIGLDDADAFVLTFARPVMPAYPVNKAAPAPPRVKSAWT